MATSQRHRNRARIPTDDTEFIDYSALPAKPTLSAWAVITAALVLVAIVALFAFALISERQQAQGMGERIACSALYERDTAQWQDCVNDR